METHTSARWRVYTVQFGPEVGHKRVACAPQADSSDIHLPETCVPLRPT
jgi:hypothetical protein